MSSDRIKTTLFALSCVLFAGMGAAMWMLHGNEPAPIVAVDRSIGGPFTLATPAGKIVTERTYRGKWEIIYFGYTFCPDICPMALGSIGGALVRLGPLSAKVQPIFITLDPKRDVPDVMSAYLKNFDSRIVGLTGTEQQINAAAGAYHVYHAIYRAGAGLNDYLVDHSSLIYVMNPEGQFAAVFGSDISSDALATQIRIFIGNIS